MMDICITFLLGSLPSKLFLVCPRHISRCEGSDLPTTLSHAHFLAHFFRVGVEEWHYAGMVGVFSASLTSCA